MTLTGYADLVENGILGSQQGYLASSADMLVIPVFLTQSVMARRATFVLEVPGGVANPAVAAAVYKAQTQALLSKDAMLNDPDSQKRYSLAFVGALGSSAFSGAGTHIASVTADKDIEMRPDRGAYFIAIQMRPSTNNPATSLAYYTITHSILPPALATVLRGVVSSYGTWPSSVSMQKHITTTLAPYVCVRSALGVFLYPGDNSYEPQEGG